MGGESLSVASLGWAIPLTRRYEFLQDSFLWLIFDGGAREGGVAERNLEKKKSSSLLRQEHFLGRALGESARLGGVLARGGVPQRWVEPGRANWDVAHQEVTRPCDLLPPAPSVGGFSGPEGRSGG